ncbi:MAG: FAD-dependent oxidoreductase [Pseudomonadota bacterium]
MPTLQLHCTALSFQDLFTSNGLQQLDHDFLNYLNHADAGLYHHLLEYRQATLTLSATQTSELLIALAIQIEQFIAKLLNIENELAISQESTQQKNPIAVFRKEFLLTKVKRLLHSSVELPSFSILHQQLLAELNKHTVKIGDLELEVATLGLFYLKESERFKVELEHLTQWCAQALLTKEGRDITQNWESFRFPEKLDYAHLIPTKIIEHNGVTQHALPKSQLRERDGFDLTDKRMSAQAVQNEIHYCIYCHDHEGDLCSKGFPVSKKDKTLGFKKNPLNVTMTGCPLEERISEMHALKRDGYTIGALAMVMLDNPMCPATGHRICNDCMKACIYQKQTPVNIPQIETRVLTDVLALPWGVEIYDLLTRWNPLLQNEWHMQPYNGKKIMIAGMGPAGFTLAHYLLQAGCAVVGFDGLKIEPLPVSYITQPIHDYQSIIESLDDRIVAGFGGVAEYGITVRWDKNFLKLIYITLMRRPYFQVFGNIRFGGTVTIEDAWHLGFDHFVIAVGAGLPKALPVKNSMATGMRQANDFLMALQLTGAAKKESFSSLEIRLPVLVIGGGLTGIDAATEAQAYYIRQVEKIAARYELVKDKMPLTETLQEFLLHASKIKQERERAKIENREPCFIELIHQWGGVSVVYRQAMQASPAYVNNHEELYKALEEGVFYIENLSPVQVNLDAENHCAAMTFKTKEDGIVTLPAKSILVATGASLNVAYSFEHPHAFERKSMEYLSYEEKNGELFAAHSSEHCKDPHFGPFTSYHAHHEKKVSFIGDTHPVFHGNVVKAIASAKYTYPKIMKHLKNINNKKEYFEFKKHIQHQLTSIIIDIRHPSDNLIEIEVQAPQAIKHYRAGQFYRMQVFEAHTKFSKEAPWLFASDVDHNAGTLIFTLTQKEARENYFDHLIIGDSIALMGPTGVRSKISDFHETILIIGNQKSLSHVRSYAKALKEKGNKIVFLGYFKQASEIFYRKEIEAICDQTLWAEDCIEALKEYAESKTPLIPLTEIDRIQVIGDSTQLKEIVQLQKQYLKDKLPKAPKITASVHSHMQCMLKGVCAQCLQWQINPDTGERTKAVFACSWQDQPIEIIDLDHLASREKQNNCQETLNQLYYNS